MSDNQEQTARGANISDQELSAAIETPAVYCHRMLATNTAAGMRLSFGETGPKGITHFRFAAFLTYADAFALVDLLNRQLEQVQEITIEPPTSGQKK